MRATCREETEERGLAPPPSSFRVRLLTFAVAAVESQARRGAHAGNLEFAAASGDAMVAMPLQLVHGVVCRSEAAALSPRAAR